ncbi:hypothetical protein ACFLXJ_01660 [Chloroflexota bacterium]
MNELLRLENVADTKGQQSEQVASSEAECQKRNIEQDDCIKETHSSLVDYAIKLFDAEVVSVDEVTHPADAEVPSSPGFIPLTVNADKVDLGFSGKENNQVQGFNEYRCELANKRVLVVNLADNSIAKVVKPADASRYFPVGRKRIKAKVFKRLGRWFNCPGYLLSLTFDPKIISREDAWRLVGLLRREFMDRVNRWRKRHGMPKAKFLAVLEVQPSTGYPHVHLVFPYLKWLAPIAWMTEQWGQAENSVDYKIRDSMSPVSYVCKYISKLEGWSDLALSYLWVNRTRLYSMSRDYVLPDYSDKRVPEWCFAGSTTRYALVKNFSSVMSRYDTMLGAEDIVEMIMILRTQFLVYSNSAKHL